jgi:tRNA threonylcarbamoyladenosine modification (KEOPS) complex Cgi121 subunit
MHKEAKPVAYLCSSSLSKEQILECIKKSSDSQGFAQVFKNKKGISDRLLAAYLNAKIRKEEGTMRSNSLAIEMLLFVSGQMNISKAIPDCGISSGDEFILFASNEEYAKKAIECSKSNVIKELKLSLFNKEAPRVAVSELLEF